MTTTITAAVRRFVRDEEGASMAEYALLIAAVAVVAAVAIRKLGTTVSTKLDSAATEIAK